MGNARSKFIGLAVTGALGSLIAGCGLGADQSSDGTNVDSALETARVQTFLDSRYRAGDVWHSFHTKFGETIDCIDFFAQPGVKALAAAGTPITTLPPAPKMTATLGPLADVAFTGQPDDQGKPRACPTGSVPLVRITADQVKQAGGLDAFTAARRKHSGPPLPGGRAGATPTPPSPVAPPTSDDIPGFAHVTSTFGGTNVTSGWDVLSVFTPVISTKRGTHSLSQVWMYSGTGTNLAGKTCTTDCTQSVEAGVLVSPEIYGDANPHFFTFSTTDGYKTGCYDNAGMNCPTWVGFPSAFLAPGQTLSSGAPGGSQSEIAVRVSFEIAANNTGIWDVQAGFTHMPGVTSTGYFPASNFGGGRMQSSASTFIVGSEISDTDSYWISQMGSGADPSAGYGQAGYHHDFGACTTGGCPDATPFAGPAAKYGLVGLSMAPLQHDPYTYSTSATPGPGWRNYFFVGNAPQVFYSDDYGYPTYAPILSTDWAFGNFKGQCPSGHPLVGVSDTVSPVLFQREAEAFLCGETFIPGSSGCQGEVADNKLLGNPGFNWDPPNPKAECPLNMFVQGISQSTVGAFNQILCCPIAAQDMTISQAACSVEVFDGGNSASYASPDWNYGAYKGQCPAGLVVTGVSVNGEGIPRAILCCPP